MYRTSFRCLVLVLFFSAIKLTPAYSQTISTKLSPVPHSELDEYFKAYHIVQIENQILEDWIATTTSEQNPLKHLNISEKNSWKLNLYKEEVLGQSNNTYSIVNGKRIKNKFTSNTFNLNGYTSIGFPVRLTLGHNFLMGCIAGQSADTYIEPLKYHVKNASDDLYIVYNSSDIISSEDFSCGVMDKRNLSNVIGKKLSQKSAGNCYEIDLAIASDFAMFNWYGSVASIEARNISILNMVKLDYINSFADEIEINLVEQVVFTGGDPWAFNSNSTVMLTNFTNWAVGGGFVADEDIGTLWTRIDIASTFSGPGVVGLAWLNSHPRPCCSNSTCTPCQYSGGSLCTDKMYNILEDYAASTAEKRTLMSHEIGHNFGAFHNDAGTFIMNSFITANTNWSMSSIDSIDVEINTYNSCLINCPTCTITEISADNFSICSDGNFTADVNIIYNTAPTSGNLTLSGDASASTSSFSPTGHTFIGIQFPADGEDINLTASFSAEPLCTLTESNAGVIPTPSTITQLVLLGQQACVADSFTSDVFIQYLTSPPLGYLHLNGDGIDSINVTSLSGNSHIFQDVKMLADGSVISLTANFSDNLSCSYINNGAGLAPSHVSDISVSNITACNNGNFEADVLITYASLPPLGYLKLTGDALDSVAVSTLLPLTYLFEAVSMPAHGGSIDLSCAFTYGAYCGTNNPSAGQAPTSIDSISLSDLTVCDNDTFTADVIVKYPNKALSGTLGLTGDGTSSVSVTAIGDTMHIFQDVVMIADGSAIDLTVGFSDNTACLLSNTNVGTAPDPCVCKITNITTSNISSCSGANIYTADVTIDYIAPAVGNLTLSGDVSVSADPPDPSSSYTFTNLMMTADGLPINITATFDNDAACTFTNSNSGIAPGPCTGSCSAGLRTWNGGTDSNWNEATNWTPNCVPTAADDVVIPNTALDPQVMSSIDGYCKSLEILTGAKLTVNGGASLNYADNDIDVQSQIEIKIGGVLCKL